MQASAREQPQGEHQKTGEWNVEAEQLHVCTHDSVSGSYASSEVYKKPIT